MTSQAGEEWEQTGIQLKACLVAMLMFPTLPGPGFLHLQMPVRCPSHIVKLD